MEALLGVNEWGRVEYYVDALEDFTKAEPLQLTDLLIARGRALADFGRGKRNDATIQELRRLRDEAKSVGLNVAIPALEKALSRATR